MTIVKNIPNFITLGRLCAVPALVWFIISYDYEIAFWIFLAAAISDALDGILANAMHARTSFGSYLDPIADKALLIGTYVSASIVGLIPSWLTILVVSRDILIIGGVLVLQTMRKTIQVRPVMLSKINTAAQMAFAAIILANTGIGIIIQSEFIVAASYIVALTTVLSGAFYISIGYRAACSNGEV